MYAHIPSRTHIYNIYMSTGVGEDTHWHCAAVTEPHECAAV